MESPVQMNLTPGRLFAVIWIGWFVSWMAAAAFWSSRAQKRIATWNVWAYRVLVVVGAALLWAAAHRWTHDRIWTVGVAGAYVFAAVTFAGISFTWWARFYLGRLWSSAITRKQDHRVIDTGPYAFVRHPIYSGLILALFATAAAEGAVVSIAGATFVSFGLWLKAREEERFLVGELGADYRAYRRRVPMLVPFLRPRQDTNDR
jgi:protein-S-isoprenylcysteine O-methyltransferase Ste14